MTGKLIMVATAAIIPLAMLGVGGWRFYMANVSTPPPQIPTTHVRRGDVDFTVGARGELSGGNTETLSAPMVGGSGMVITSLRKPGEIVKAGEVVAQFDTTEQEFQLREAEADLAEAEQRLAQAKAESLAKEEEARYLLIQAEAEVRLAELECRRNELIAAIVAKQNTLAREAARDRLNQLKQDLGSRKATTEAGVAIQEAGVNKAKVKAETARRMIQSMTLRAKSEGYVAVQQNTNSNFVMWGMQFPIYQVGDNVRAGMGVAQIPDLKNWEVGARIGEMDRGHLAVGQPASIQVIALPGKTFNGKVKNLGGTTGPPWDRNFECKITLDNPSMDLRPGMSGRITVTTGVMKNVLYLPSQALFESDGRTFVYAKQGGSFAPVDVKLIRRSDRQVVIDKIAEGQVVAMANPVQRDTGAKGQTGALQALPGR